MTRVTVRNRRGETVEVETLSATEAKNSFGEVLDRAIAKGIVAITRRDKPRVVVLSIEEYEALTQPLEDSLENLRGEFDALVERMQTSEAKAAGRALFAASPRRLGHAGPMRTTLDIDDDILEAVKEIASNRGATAGKVFSELARKALEPTEPPLVRNGVPLLPRRPASSPTPTMALVNSLRDEP
jgi:antitoxin Phd